MSCAVEAGVGGRSKDGEAGGCVCGECEGMYWERGDEGVAEGKVAGE